MKERAQAEVERQAMEEGRRQLEAQRRYEAEQVAGLHWLARSLMSFRNACAKSRFSNRCSNNP